MINFSLHLLINLAQLIIFAKHLWRKEISFKAFMQRFAFFLPQGNYDIWLHCASIGEARVLSCFAKHLINTKPDIKILISVQRIGAEKIIQSTLPSQSLAIFYFPLDCSLVWKRFFKQITVAQLICIESEIWPKLAHKAQDFGLKIDLINGRISTKSFNYFQKFSFFAYPVLAKLNYLYVQNELYAQRFSQLGIDTKKIEICGNLKYDLIGLHPAKNKTNQEKVLVFVSSRDGEEELIKAIIPELKKQIESLKIIIIPRHQDRFEKVYQSFKPLGAKKYTQFKLNHDLIIVDAFNQMQYIYPLADLVLVGGTFKNYGGHSIIEPASFAKAILVGPFIDHISEDVGLFEKNEAIIRITNSQNLKPELKQKIIELITDEQKLKILGNNAQKTVANQQGICLNLAKKYCAQLIKLD